MPEIARLLGRSVRTIQAHRYSLGRKLEVKSSLSLARLAIEFGLAPINPSGDGNTASCRAQEALAVIEAGSTAMNDRNSLDQLVCHLAQALELRCVLVAEHLESNPSQTRVIAGWLDGQPLEHLTLPRANCPCADQTTHAVHRIPSGLAEAYPNVDQVREAGLDSYMGMALVDANGQKIGTLSILDDTPINDSLYPETILKIFAARAAAELQRCRDQRALQRSEARYQAVATGGGNPIARLDDETCLTFVNSAMARLLNVETDQLHGQKLLDFLPLEDQQRLLETMAQVDATDASRPVAIRFAGDLGCSSPWQLQAIHSGDDGMVEYQVIVPREG